MGDPKHSKKVYSKPRVPWQGDRLVSERALMQEFGLRRKKEVYRANSQLKKYKETAKRLVVAEGDQAEKEKEQLFSKLQRYGLLKEPSLTSVLSITVNQLLNRRLQTQLVKKKLAKTVNQARQLIVHRHVVIGDKKISSPSYLVSVDEEDRIAFHPSSPYYDEDHPERFKPELSEEEKEQIAKIDDQKEDTDENQDAQDDEQ